MNKKCPIICFIQRESKKMVKFVIWSAQNFCWFVLFQTLVDSYHFICKKPQMKQGTGNRIQKSEALNSSYRFIFLYNLIFHVQNVSIIIVCMTNTDVRFWVRWLTRKHSHATATHWIKPGVGFNIFLPIRSQLVLLKYKARVIKHCSLDFWQSYGKKLLN